MLLLSLLNASVHTVAAIVIGSVPSVSGDIFETVQYENIP